MQAMAHAMEHCSSPVPRQICPPAAPHRRPGRPPAAAQLRQPPLLRPWPPLLPLPPQLLAAVSPAGRQQAPAACLFASKPAAPQQSWPCWQLHRSCPPAGCRCMPARAGHLAPGQQGVQQALLAAALPARCSPPRLNRRGGSLRGPGPAAAAPAQVLLRCPWQGRPGSCRAAAVQPIQLSWHGTRTPSTPLQRRWRREVWVGGCVR
jgi:hypothetical protein